MDTMQLSNVSYGDSVNNYINSRLRQGTTARLRVHSQLDPVINALALLRPTWKFMATDAGMSGDNSEEGFTKFVLTEFNVVEDGEILGQIGRGFSGRAYKIVVSNHRIAQKTERSNCYRTEDPKKAVARVKKEFGRRSPQERISDAADRAHEYAYQAIRKHDMKVREAVSRYKPRAEEWVNTVGFQHFLAHLKETNALEHDTILSSKQRAEELRAEMSVLEDIRSKLGSTKSALIVRDFDQYIVRIGDKVAIHDDNDLPAALRGRLGLLKLVDKEHFVPGAGCRVSEEVFVVVLDEEDGTNSVSEGA